LTDQARIFEPFFSGTGGTGLGLAIASQLVREHGGRLTVDSQPGQGAVFTVTLKPAESTG
jgi:signal transduction histidine kinase